ncbi:MAG: HAD-IA family hydrolase, partial [Nanobdellota archaeon]
MGIKAVLFDLDNTIYDYDSIKDKALDASYDVLKEKVKIKKKDFLDNFYKAREQIHKDLSGTASSHNRVLYFHRLSEILEEDIEPKTIIDMYNAYWDKMLSLMKPNPGLKKTLIELKGKGKKIAVVTDMTTDIQLRKIDRLGISGYVDFLITSEEAGSEKPHSIMFLLALNKLSVSPKEALMIGDNLEADIEGANFAGLHTALLSKRKIEEEEKVKPNHHIKKLDETLSIIDRIELKDVQEEGYIKFKLEHKKTKALRYHKIKDINSYRQKLYKMGLIGAYENKIGYGNISRKVKEGILISGSTTGNYKRLNGDHYSIIYDYDIKNNKLYCKGPIKASSESMTHAAIYECDKSINAVIHVHDLSMWERYKDNLPTTSQDATYGTPEIAKEIKRLYKETELKDKKIAVLGGHKEGLIAFGNDLEEAFSVIKEYHDA